MFWIRQQSESLFTMTAEQEWQSEFATTPPGRADEYVLEHTGTEASCHIRLGKPPIAILTL